MWLLRETNRPMRPREWVSPILQQLHLTCAVYKPDLTGNFSTSGLIACHGNEHATASVHDDRTRLSTRDEETRRMCHLTTPAPFLRHSIQSLYACGGRLYHVVFTRGREPTALEKASQRNRGVQRGSAQLFHTEAERLT